AFPGSSRPRSTKARPARLRRASAFAEGDAGCGNRCSARRSPGNRPPRRAGPGSRSPRAASGRRPSACACAAPRLLEEAPLLELAALAPVEGRDRAVVAHDARPDLAGLLFPVLLPALRAGGVLAGEVAVARADGERGRDGDVGEAEALERAAHERLAGFRAREPLGHI